MRASRARFIALLSISIVLILMGAGSIATYFALSERTENASPLLSRSMRDWVPAEAIHERVALGTLAGWPEPVVMDQALAEGEADTALCVAVHSLALADRERAGAFLRVAGAYAEQQRADLARALYRKVVAIAILSPALSDLTRAELLMEIAYGLVGLGHRKEAVELLDQAGQLVEASTELKPAQREQLRESLQRAYQRAGAKRAIVAQKKQPSSIPAWPRISVAEPAIELNAVISLDIGAMSSERLRQAHTARQEAAARLIQFQQSRRGERPAALVAELKEALLAEDAAIEELKREADLPAIEKISLELHWLAVKSQVARRMFGLSLVPEWEAQAGEIDAAWRSTWDAFLVLRQDIVLQAADSSVAQAELQLELAMAEVLAGELGLIPGYPLAQGLERLQQAIELRQREAPARPWTPAITMEDAAVRVTIRQAN